MKASSVSVAPIGTCRINTPFKRGAARYPITLDYQRVYGFVHTSAEALQQLLYRSGERDMVSSVLPILIRPGDARWNEPPQKQPADLTVIEISSGKDCRAGDVAVQANYLETHFSDFFRSAKRARRAFAFWELARSGDRTRIQAFLDADPVYQRYDEQDRALLASISVRDQKYEELLADMASMVDVLGKKQVLFVTHVNAAGSDGNIIPARDKHIRWVKQAALKLGIGCFDPTDAMREFGQEKAMERGGSDSTHFTNAFSDRLYALLHRQYILPLTGADAESEDGNAESAADILLADSIAVAIEDDFYEGSRELFRAMKHRPAQPLLEMLRGQVLAEIGDYDGAIALLSGDRDVEMTLGMRKAAMRALLETGDSERALSVAKELLADEYEDVEIYEAAGLAAEQLGNGSDAVHYRKLAFRLAPTNASTATSVLDFYRANGDGERFAEWLDEVLDLLEAGGSGAVARGIAEWAIAVGDQQAIARALVVLARCDAVVFPALLEDAIGAGMQVAIAPAVAAIANMPDLDDRIVRVLRGVAAQWGETSQALFAEDRLRAAYEMATACVSVMPGNRTARRVQRASLNALGAQVGHAVKSRDEAAVVRLCNAAGDMVYQRRDIATAFVKALTTQDRVAEAQAVAQRLHDSAPQDIDYRAQLARVATMNDDFLTAFQLYSGLADEDPESTKRHQLRIDQFMSRARKTGIRHLRSLMAEGRIADAIRLARLIENESNHEQIANELKRILATLRARLREIDGHDGGREALDLLRLMLEIEPADPLILRRAGLEAMKQDEFETALGYWRRLDEIAPSLEIVSRQIKRCEILIGRRTAPPRRNLEVQKQRTAPRTTRRPPAQKARKSSAK